MTEVRAVAHPDSVLVTWQASAGETEFVVQRDGVTVATVHEPRYKDRNVVPLHAYVYSVAVVTPAAMSSPSDVHVKTTAPPLKQARLFGSFDVRLTLRSSYGFSGLDPKGTAGWHFRPLCDKGACDVAWANLGTNQGFKLSRSGVSYEGSGSGKFGTTCSGVRSTETMHITVRVTHAGVVGGEWRAERIEGTLVESVAQQLGCRSGGITTDFTGRLA